MPPSPDSSSSQPLLHADHDAATSNIQDQQGESMEHRTARYKRAYTFCRQRVHAFLSSRYQHYTILALVSFDLLGIFADIIITLYQCDEGDTDPKWDVVRNALGIAGLVFSCFFMLELILCVWAYGWGYFRSKFHCFDAAVILAGFVTDVLLKGVIEEVASLVVILRLWRFFKIIEEFSVGAEEQMEGLELRIEQLESENQDLKRELKKQKGTVDEEEEIGFQSGSGTWK